jgi:threonine/homoserine/homoserine lactone efflux protein
MHSMKNPTWPKTLAFVGFTIFGLTLAFYSTAIATAGVAAGRLGTDSTGEWLSTGSAILLVGIAAAAAFGFLALSNARALMRRG